MAIICIAMYSVEGIYSTKIVKLLLDQDILSSIIFPNVVFSSYIIILCVVIMSYILGYPMPDILVRIFNAIAVILYLVTIGISGFMWSLMKDIDEKTFKIECMLLFTVIILCCLNCFLHAFDIYWNIRRILEDINK